MVLEDVVHTLPCPLLIEGLPLRIGAQQHAGDIENDHGGAEGPSRPGLGNGLGTHAHGVGHTPAQVPVQVVALPGPLQPGALPGDAVVLGVGDGAEGLGEVIAPLAQGLTLRRDGEVHPVSGPMVEAVGLHKVQAASGCIQPLLLHAVAAAQEGENPAAPALHPHALVGGVDLAPPVQAGVDAAVLLVHAVRQPEIGGALQLAFYPGLGLQQFFSVHS